jgi:hypothetical protein
MRHLLLSLMLCGAPVPKHLFPEPPPDPIAPGFVWWFHGYRLQVVKVEGEVVTYRCTTCPEMTWTRSPCGTPGLSVQARETTRCEARAHTQHPEPGLPDWVYRER